MRYSIVLITAILSIIVVSGCDSGSDSDLVERESSVIEMMKRTPVDLQSFMYANVKALREDRDINKYLDISMGPVGYLDSYGMDNEDIDQMYIAGYVTGLRLIPPLQMAKGDFDLPSVRDLLRSERYTEHEYTGVEIWDVEIDNYADAVAVIDDVVIIGHEDVVRDSILANQGENLSLYDDVDFREVIHRLPMGISVACTTNSFLGQHSYDGLRVSGLSTRKKGSDEIELYWICKFDSEDSAKDALDPMRNDIQSNEGYNFEDIQLKRDGQFVGVGARTGVDNYFGAGEDE